MYEIINADVFAALEKLRSEGRDFDALITDPPYSSGGLYASSRQGSTSKKYTNTKVNCPYADFEGDNKDQRSWTRWMTEWLILAKQVLKKGAPICLFIDWRQLPAATDALQWAGFIWRGVAPWNKENCRPQKGRFKAQCEYIVWGSNGDMPITRNVPPLPGVFSYSNVLTKDRFHQTQKPLGLMCDVVRICEPGGTILDPFAGSGSTIEAARLEGYNAVGIDISGHYTEIAKTRLKGI